MTDTYPTSEEFIADPREDAIISVRRSLRSILGGIIVFFFAIGAVYGINYAAATSEYFAALPFFAVISPRWLAIIPLGILLEIIRRHNDDLYVFGKSNLTHLGGRLSLSYKVPSIKYAHIRAVVIKQSVFGRIFDYGNIELGTAANEGVEVVMGGIYKPRELGKLIEDLQHYNRDKMLAELESEQAQSAVNAE